MSALLHQVLFGSFNKYVLISIGIIFGVIRSPLVAEQPDIASLSNAKAVIEGGDYKVISNYLRNIAKIMPSAIPIETRQYLIEYYLSQCKELENNPAGINNTSYIAEWVVGRFENPEYLEKMMAYRPSVELFDTYGQRAIPAFIKYINIHMMAPRNEKVAQAVEKICVLEKKGKLRLSDDEKATIKNAILPRFLERAKMNNPCDDPASYVFIMLPALRLICPEEIKDGGEGVVTLCVQKAKDKGSMLLLLYRMVDKRIPGAQTLIKKQAANEDDDNIHHYLDQLLDCSMHATKPVAPSLQLLKHAKGID